ncbi:MAG: hypothetical protein Q7P63_08410 [Verrucomicrobiota bacterium JB022]|nr:hypothetical protein [Verrucomicrobiota bacterium JB022]
MTSQLLLPSALCLALHLIAAPAWAKIDREALVTRHNPHITVVDPEAAASVGNGDFAFTADVTGLQSLPGIYYREGLPLETLSTWAWHAFPNTENLALEDSYQAYPFYGREIDYPARQRSPAGNYYRQNPHPVPLGQIGFLLDGEPLREHDLEDIDQHLDLWTGLLHSTYLLDGEPVEVVTAAGSDAATLGVAVESPLLVEGRLSISFRFPLSYDTNIKNKSPLIFDQPEAHQTKLLPGRKGTGDYLLQRDTLGTRYYVAIRADGQGELREAGPHQFVFAPQGGDRLRLGVQFSPERPSQPQRAGAILEDSEKGWKDYWTDGGVVQLNKSSDPRAIELERRIILSQYLMRVNYAGSFPPAEGGLTHITWFGKHNSEMYFWHSAHWYEWGRTRYLAKSLEWYRKILPAGMEVARRQGFKGVRWPKMSGIDGRPSPGGINPFIIWNQPNPIYLCELVYRDDPKPETLEYYRDIVFASADFLASYAQKDPETGYYNLGPPIKAVSESTHENDTRNPTFELNYWHFALKLAQEWRERMGLERDPQWQEVLEGLAPLATYEGKYLEIETFDGIYTDGRPDPNSMILAFGYMPQTDKLDPEIMRATFKAVTESSPNNLGRWVSWSMGASALTCTRLEMPQVAVAILTNTAPEARFMPTGHVRRPKEPDGVVAFLPVNASLLNAVGLMAAGWENAPDREAPGFPDDGTWVVEVEDMNEMP